MDSLVEYFGTNDLYKVIGAKKSDKIDKISRLFKNMCFKHHRGHRELAIKKTQVRLLKF